MKKILRFYFVIACLLVSLFGCNKHESPNGFKAHKAELGQNWSQFKHDASFKSWVFKDADYPTRPTEHVAPNGVRFFWNGEVSQEELTEGGGGIDDMLAMCKRDSAESTPPNIWTQYQYFTQPSEYKIILVPSNYEVQEGESAGCAGLITGEHGDCGNGPATCSAAGTVAGINDIDHDARPGSSGGIYILVAKQSAEQWANPQCRIFFRNAIRNEGEHVFFTNDPARYFLHANDGINGSHPYCRGQ